MEKTQNIIPIQEKKVTITTEVVNTKKDMRKYLRKQEINNILSNMPAGTNKILIQLLWMSGLRVTEAINIKKRNIDFINKRMTVIWQKNRRWKERIIPIHSLLNDVLQFYCAGFNMDDKIFPFTRQWVYKIIKKYCNTSPHSLRHSFAVNFLEQCKNPTALVILQRLLGHSHIQTTMEYLKIVPNDMALELEKVIFY